MPRVQYSRPQHGVSITKNMLAPKNYADINAWFKQACKTIPEIPSRWFRPEPIISNKTIIFELIEQGTRDKCAVIVDRTPA